MKDWHVEYTVLLAREHDAEQVADEVLARFSAWSPAMSVAGNELCLAVTVGADDLKSASVAVEDGISAFFGNALEESVRLVVCRQTDFEAGLTEPPFPPFMGIGEIAAELGVSKQRASELCRKSNFPPPVASLAAGPVWVASSVHSFVKDWPRQGGRPRRALAEHP